MAKDIKFSEEESSKLGCIQRIRDGASLVVIEFMKRTFEKISRTMK